MLVRAGQNSLNKLQRFLNVSFSNQCDTMQMDFRMLAQGSSRFCNVKNKLQNRSMSALCKQGSPALLVGLSRAPVLLFLRIESDF